MLSSIFELGTLISQNVLFGINYVLLRGHTYTAHTKAAAFIHKISRAEHYSEHGCGGLCAFLRTFLKCKDTANSICIIMKSIEIENTKKIDLFRKSSFVCK